MSVSLLKSRSLFSQRSIIQELSRLTRYKCEINAVRWVQNEGKLDWVVICDYRQGRLQCHGCKYGVELMPENNK